MSTIACLDISPRQTGKTTRLIKLASKLLTMGATVRFVCSRGMKAEVQRQLPGAIVLADGEPLPRGHDPERGVWFYDEFDWLESVVLRDGAYYATTPRFIRKLGEHTPENDLLMRLVEANGNWYQRHTWPFDMSDTLKEARQLHSPSEFRRLYLGEFLE
ncbi:hypothetical protein AO946_23390 [Pseudomonas aeruginosa]|uniref:hypothetical protein n=1 Tax=Pseudomonas aeruginosa TaxID=287 RepID=UPI00071BB825|nr:hypothetical protein [Pseudomonas aeruginosa]EKW6685220.1 hypothetical protein [Pseudomonas aeruginosa]KSG23115.1 hypothetical protein AO946_23390 [Pseudomonas aeruginosa]MBG5058422.1 hypothetical protein [Pseudomonas aeruginosa]MCS7700320.1 hypothetical protein [Pseudomonas aeruginosa]RRJ13867.1 hypothetical protein EIM05_22385 [Pseudomonas aeruginosa]